MAQATISVRVDSYDKAAFDSFCSRVGLNTSSVINLFVKKVIAEERIPFEISISRKTTLEMGRNAFYRLRKEAAKNGRQDMTLEEINGEINDVRRESRV